VSEIAVRGGPFAAIRDRDSAISLCRCSFYESQPVTQLSLTHNGDRIPSKPAMPFKQRRWTLHARVPLRQQFHVCLNKRRTCRLCDAPLT
jgi:hypothetical protein